MGNLSEMELNAEALGIIPIPASGSRVLVVENNVDDAEMLTRFLRRHGYKVSRAASAAEALQAFNDAEIMLIDLDLPDLDGLEVCRSVRSTSNIPMIAVTRRGTELDRVLGLYSGADDYIVKPYGYCELMARMRALMRRVNPRQPTVTGLLVHDGLRIDVTSRQVMVDGRSVELTRKEFELLHLLATRAGRVVPRKQIMAQVWGHTWSRRTLDTHISSLRNKLGSGDWIVTVRGVGFRLGHVCADEENCENEFLAEA